MKQDYLSQPNSSRKRITKTIFMRCFDLKTLPNRGGTFSNGQRQSPISLVNTCNIIVQLVNLVYTCQQNEGGSVKTCPKVQGTMADRQGFTDLRELCWLVDRFNFSNRVLGQFSLGLIVCREELQRPHRQTGVEMSNLLSPRAGPQGLPQGPGACLRAPGPHHCGTRCLCRIPCDFSN